MLSLHITSSLGVVAHRARFYQVPNFQVSRAVIPSDLIREPLVIARKNRNPTSFGVLLLVYQNQSCYFTGFLSITHRLSVGDINSAYNADHLTPCIGCVRSSAGDQCMPLVDFHLADSPNHMR